jgi:hypothetical protein
VTPGVAEVEPARIKKTIKPSVDRIDRRIWLYWEGAQPAYLGLCIETVRAQNPNAEVVLLDRAGFDELFVHDRDIDLDRLTPVKRSDFLRAYLLREFGGLYIDVDCVVLDSLEPAFAAAESTGFSVVHQDDGELQTNFMLSPAGGPVVCELYDRICATLRGGGPLAWLDLATVPLMPAIEAYPDTVTLLPTNRVAPIHWSEPERFLARAPDEVHRGNLDEQALCYMLSNDMIKKGENTRQLCDLGRRELLEDDTFLSFLFRRALGARP